MALSQPTKNVVGGSFTLNIQFAFGYGCDHPGYVVLAMAIFEFYVNHRCANRHNAGDDDQVTAKTALQNAADELAERVIPRLVQ